MHTLTKIVLVGSALGAAAAVGYKYAKNYKAAAPAPQPAEGETEAPKYTGLDKETAKAAAKQTAEDLKNGAVKAWGTTKEAGKAVGDIVNKNYADEIARGKETAEQVKEKAAEVYGQAKEKVTGAFETAKGKVSDTYDDAREKVSEKVDEARDSVKSAVDNVADKVTGVKKEAEEIPAEEAPAEEAPAEEAAAEEKTQEEVIEDLGQKAEDFVQNI